MLDCSDTESDFSFDLNVKSMHRTIRAFLPGMLEKGQGLDRQHRLRRLLGARHPEPLRLWRLEGRRDRPHQVGGGRLHPQGRALQRHLPRHDREPSLDGRIETLSRSSGESVEKVRQAFIDRQPMGRLGKPEEIAAIAVYLASDESAFTTGQAYLVDGGFAL